MAHRLAVGAALLLFFVLPVVSHAQTVAFLDEGAPASTLLDGSTARIRVTDAAANVTSGRDSVSATVTSTLAGDSESVPLQETGPGTGVFEGVIELEPGGSLAAPTLATATDPGPPPARDTLEATYNSATASAGLVGSTIHFLDDWGRESATFAAGHEMRLRVRDELRNNPLGRDYLVLPIASQSAGDSEYITLFETGMNTGVFEGVVGTTRAPVSPSNGELNLAVPDVVAATLSDADNLASSTSQAQIAGSVVVLLDADGNPAADFVESARVHIVVIDPSRTSGTANVQVTASLSGDSETVSLSAIDGGAFAGEIPTLVSPGTPPPTTPGDGTLQIGEVWGPPMQLDTVTVSYTGGDGTTSAAAPFIPGRLSFLNARGEATSSYAAGTEARVRLEYQGYDTPGRLDLATVRLVNAVTGEEEYMRLTETGRDTGVFIGSMPLTVNGPGYWFDGSLNAQPGQQIQVNHGETPQPVAEITDVSLEFLDERGEPTEEIVESGVARVRMWSVVGNADPLIADTASVEMRTLLSDDLETLTLSETGPDTNLFEGSMALEMGSYGDPDGMLQTANSGMPDYRQDEIMARSGSVEATARTTGARIEFVDASGKKVSGYVSGEIARLRIVDHFWYGDVFSVTVVSLGTGDSETVTMRETSSTSGVFEGSIPTQLAGAEINGRVGVDLVDQIEVRHLTGFNPIELTERAEIRASSVAFVDAAGQPVDVYLESSRVWVRVVSAAANSYPGTFETVSVELVSELGPDVETLTLTETGLDTGVFAGSIQMRLSFGVAQPGNGMLETLEAGHPDYDPPHEFDTLRATYNGAEGTAVAQAGLTGSRTWFGNAAGEEVLSYVAGGTAYLWVEDQNLNELGQWNEAQVVVRSLATGDQEYLMLPETSRDSGIFTLSLPLESAAAAQGDGRLQAQDGEQIEVVHQDSYGATASSAVADIDALGLEFFDETGEPTAELLESGEARVRMFHLGGNANPGTAETASVSILSLRSGDQESVILTETGPDTGVFEGSIPMAVGAGSPINGTLETRNSGSPGYLADEVTALFSEPYQTTARVAGARVTFFDAYGRETSSYAVGEHVQVRVVDYTRRSPGVQGNVTVTLVSQDGSDVETLRPYETGLDTGVFEGSINTVLSSYASHEDWLLRVIPEDQVEARYTTAYDPNPIEAQVTVTGNAVRFVDAAGQPAAVYLESSRAYVQVVSLSSNTSQWTAETVSVQLVSELGSDAETLTLTEYGINSGIFTGSIPMRLSLTGVTPGNGTLETIESGHPLYDPPHEFDTVRATFSHALGTSVARIGLTGSRTWFADAVGQEALSFAAGGTAFIRVEDQNHNEPGQWNEVQVRVRSLTTGDQEDLMVPETARESGIFAIFLALERSATATPGDGRLQVQPGEQIEVVHQDSYGATYSSAVADIVEASLEFIDEAGEPTTELLESGDARLRMFSLDGNSNPGAVEALTAEVQTLRSGDQETVLLTETGPDTGLFEGSIPMAAGPGYPGSGALETRNSGDPEYLPELVTARSGQSLATAQVLDARVFFLDVYGREVESYAAGETVRVRVVDHNRNYSQNRDSLSVYLTSRDVNDGESLELQETGSDTGVFEGALPTAANGSAAASDGELGVDLEDEIEVRHTLANNPNGMVATAAITGNAVLFVDAAGRPVDVYLESSRAYVRVVSASGNANPGSAESVTVEIRSELTPDIETLALTETGPNTAVFEGSLPTRLSLAGVTQGNGTVEVVESGHPIYEPPHEFDTLRATFSDAAGTSVARIGLTGSRTWFADAAGEEVFSFPRLGTVYIYVEDQNHNEPGQWNEVQVRVRSLGAGADQEDLMLRETTRDSGIFTGSIRLVDNASAVPGDGLLIAGVGDQIEASHQDYSGATSSTAVALITAASIEFFDETGAATQVLLESGPARVRLFSSINNWSPGADSIAVQIGSLRTGDTASLVLTETGGDTNVFEGSIPMAVGPAQSGDGVLQTRNSGDPEYLPDQVTATWSAPSGTASATARIDGSYAAFIDLYGRETSSFAAGETVGLRVVDHNRNAPQNRDSLFTYLVSRDGGDGEALELQETGYDTAVFEGFLPTAVNGTPYPSDDLLTVEPDDQVEATFNQVNNPVGKIVQAAITGNSVTFIDAAGEPAAVYFESSRAYVRVKSTTADVNPLSVDTVTVQLRSELGSDLETVTLTETGAKTAVFEGSVPLRLTFSAPQPGNGTLETVESGHPVNQPPHEFDTLRATYTDAAGTSVARIGLTGSRTSFVDAAGREVSAVTVGGVARIRVEDHNGNLSGQVDFVPVRLRSLTTADQEDVMLQETSGDSGIFTGSVLLVLSGATQGDGQLRVAAGEQIEASHQDSNGATFSTALAEIQASAAEFIDEAGQPTGELLESGTARVRMLNVYSNTNPSIPDTALIQLQSLYSGDLETVTLTETGADTNLFEGSIAMRYGWASSDGFLQTRNSGDPAYSPDEVSTSDGSATATVVPSRLVFLNLRGQEVSAYPQGSPVRVRLTDHNRNYDPAQVDQAGAGIFSLVSSDSEGVALTETGPNTGVFEGSIPTSGTGYPWPDGLLVAPPGLVEASSSNYNTPFQTLRQATILSAFAPVAAEDFVTTVEDNSVVIPVLANDTGDGPLTVAAVTQPEHGSVVLNPDGTVTYTPVAEYYGPDSFTYLIVDSQDSEGLGTVTVDVTSDNQAPTPNYDNVTTPEDQSVVFSVLANDTDPENQPLQVVSVTPAIPGGTVSVNLFNWMVTYTPPANFNGEAVFQYTVRDPEGLEGTSAVTVTVTPVNDAPAANDDTASTPEDTPVVIAVQANDSDIDSATWYPVSVTIPANGTALIQQPGGGEILYTPNPNFTGQDSFSYTLQDDAGATDTATVTVTVTGVNDAPVANDDTATVEEDGSVSITVLTNDTDPENNTLDVTSVTQGTNGTVTLNADETVTYAPNANFSGADSFTYTISDGNGGTATATVTVTITSVNDSPVANADAATVAEDGSVNVTVLGNDTDPENNTLDVTSVTQGTNGTVTLNADETVTYAPNANFSGADSFTYTISDGKGGTATATVTVTVTGVNDAPVANADTATVAEDGTINITVLGNDTDPENDTLDVTSVTQGTNGTVTLNADETVTYAPNANFNGTDSFTYTISDGNGGTATASVTVTITSVNDSPVANADAATVAEDGSINITVLGNDSDPENDTLDVTSVTQGTNGTVTLNADETVTYAPNANFNGTDSFTYTISDGNGGTATAAVTVTITSVNDSPVANADAATVAEDGSVNVTVLGNDTDPENNTLDVTSVTQGTNGTVTLNADETVTYTSSSNFNGTDSFTYTISDGNGGTATASVTVTITAVNDSPVANADAATVAEDGSVNVTVLGNDTDPENNTLDVTSVTQGTNGTVTLNADDTVTYAPNANFNGNDSFTYTISDGNGGTATATVTVTITDVNDSPVANADAATVAEDGSVNITVLGNDTDPENNPLDVTAVTQGANGSVTINPNQTVTYTPAANYNGSDAFTYTISDGNGGTATASVTVTITAVDDTPVALNDTASTIAETLVAIPVLSNDLDVDGPALSIASVTQPANGTVTVNANQTINYTPASAFVGSDSFTYTLTGGTAPATVNVTVNAPPRVTTNLQVLYELEEGSGTAVTDTSGVGTPLDLTIGSASAVTWISGGLSVNSATLIQSAGAATKVITASQSTNEITLEAWVDPADLSQSGPAPIVTVSQQSNKRNFTLGQSGDRWDGRLRTTSTNQAGSGLSSDVGTATLDLTHVVYTRDASGNVRIYVNGVQSASTTLTGTFSSWTGNFKLGLVNELNSSRPWHGELYLVAIYNRALSASEVRQNWLAGE